MATTMRSMCLVTVAAALWPVRGHASPTERPRLELQSSDGQSSLRVGLAAQLRYEVKRPDPASGDEDVLYGFVFRRVRPVISGRLLGEELTYLLHLNLVPGATELMDLYVDYAVTPAARLRLGQYKVPFTRHRINSFQDRVMLEWSYETRYFGAERQLGLMVHNDQNNPPAFEYQVGLFGGDNVRASNGIGVPLTYGVTPPNVSDLDDPDPLPTMHGELVGHVALNHGGINVRRPSDLEGGPLRWSVGLSAALDFAPVERLDHRLRLAPELWLKTHGYALVLVGYLGLCDEVAGTDVFVPGMAGAMISGSYLFAQRYEIGLRYTTVRLFAALRDDARADADARIADESGDAAVELATRLQGIGELIAEHEANVGLNVYLFGTTLKWQTDLGLLLHQRRSSNRYDLVARTQLALAF